MNKKRVFLVKTTDFLHDRGPRVGGGGGGKASARRERNKPP